MSWLLKAATDKLKELEESIDEAVGNTPIKLEPTPQTTTTTPTISSTSKPSTTKDDGWSAW